MDFLVIGNSYLPEKFPPGTGGAADNATANTSIARVKLIVVYFILCIASFWLNRNQEDDADRIGSYVS